MHWAINMYCEKRRDLQDGVTRRREIFRGGSVWELEISLKSGQTGGPSLGLLEGKCWHLRHCLGAESLLSPLHFCRNEYVHILATVCAQERGNERLHFINLLGHT